MSLQDDNHTKCKSVDKREINVLLDFLYIINRKLENEYL
ncbi:MAG: hypothetical protein ACI9TV_002747 [Sulfurimonas sp.]|jgi:hypothetical protein